MELSIDKENSTNNIPEQNTTRKHQNKKKTTTTTQKTESEQPKSEWVTKVTDKLKSGYSSCRNFKTSTPINGSFKMIKKVIFFP